MQFTSVFFLLFLTAVFALYWALPARFRWGAALASSLVFYLPFGLPALALLLACCVLCWGCGLFLARRPSCKGPLFLCLLFCLAPLLLFKYTSIPARFSLIAPVGISFYTFKMISYLVEVSRGELDARRHLGHVALYLAFFTEVASGPIHRPGDLLPQIECPAAFRYRSALSGAQLLLWGLFKKVVLADNIAYYVDYGFSRPDVVMGTSLILAALMYAVQIYCDFSGYSDIAIGCMGLLGYRVPENFKSPYFSTSIKEFWARWHISLSQFLRDYIYIPLGGSRCPKWRQALNLMLTFLVSGVWHGAGATFFAWGALHGAYRVFGLFTARLRAGLWRILHVREESVFARVCKTAVTFFSVRGLGALSGRKPLSEAAHIFARMPDSFSLSVQTFKNAAVMLTLNTAMVLRLGLFTLVLGAVDLLSKDRGFSAWLSGKGPVFQTLFCYFLLFSIFFYGISGTGSFIYFQF